MTVKWPKLAGNQEARLLLGVSSARVYQLIRDDPNFPKPVAVLAATPVWAVPDLLLYKDTRNLKAGRKPGWDPKAKRS